MRLLLDTCTFLWIVFAQPALSVPARAAYLDPDNEVFLSAVSAWEITVKHRLGKLPLAETPKQFVPRFRKAHGIAPLPLDEDAVLQDATLPGLHRDPFDRMLICQAICHGLILLTPDPLISQYPVRVLWPS
jgi:PIN domain nuclease of toxin-antitoxin system